MARPPSATPIGTVTSSTVSDIITNLETIRDGLQGQGVMAASKAMIEEFCGFLETIRDGSTSDPNDSTYASVLHYLRKRLHDIRGAVELDRTKKSLHVKVNNGIAVVAAAIGRLESAPAPAPTPAPTPTQSDAPAPAGAKGKNTAK